MAGQDDLGAHFDALRVRAAVAGWQGNMAEFVRYMENAYAVALDGERKDLQTIAAQALAQVHVMALELDEAELLLTRALELAGESGSVRARVSVTLAYGTFLTVKGELDAAETLVEEVRTTSSELGVEATVVAALHKLGWIARLKGDHKRSEKLLREGLRILAARGDRGMLPDLQASLAETLADQGKAEEAERLALDARANAGPQDPSCMVAATAALAAVREAQGRDEDAEDLFRSAVELAQRASSRCWRSSRSSASSASSGSATSTSRRASTKRASPSSRRRRRAPPGSPDSSARRATRRSRSPGARRAPARRAAALP